MGNDVAVRYVKMDGFIFTCVTAGLLIARTSSVDIEGVYYR